MPHSHSSSFAQVCHATDLAFWFGVQGLPPAFDASFTAPEAAVSALIQRLLVSFAATGDPNSAAAAADGAVWPPFKASLATTLVLQAARKTSGNATVAAMLLDPPGAGNCAFWDAHGYTSFTLPAL